MNLIKYLPNFLIKRIEEKKELQKIISNINWLTFENISQKIIGIFIFAWVARYLGPEQLGLMSYVVAFVALFSALSILGLDNIVIRNIISNPKKKREYLGSALFLKFLGSLLMLLLSVIGISLIEPNNNLIILFVGIISLGYIFKSFDAIDIWFKSQVQSKYSVYARSIAFLIISSLKIIFIVTQQPLIAFILIFALNSLISAILLIYFYHKKTKLSLFKWKIKYTIMKDLLKDGWPLILSGIAVMIYMRIDQVMIGNMLGNTQLGIYSVAVKLSESWLFLSMIIASSVFPAILNARKKSKKLYLNRMQTLYDSFTWFTIPIALIITFISPSIIRILYGNTYMGAATVLSILIWSGVFSFLGVASSQYLIAENLTKISFYRTTIGMVINVILNVILIPFYGIIGAAIATLISYGIATLYILIPIKSRPTGLSLLRSFNIIGIIRKITK